MRRLLFLLVFIVNMPKAVSQISDTVKPVSVPQVLMEEYNTLILEGFQAESMLPINFVKDGTIDYTNVIQNAICNYDIVVLPNFPLLINDKGLELQNDTRLVFQSQSQLILAANDKRDYSMLSIIGVKNVKVFFPNIVGDRYQHLNDVGEWGMGISIRGSKNISIIGGEISNCWGDGIYVGSNKGVSNDFVNIAYTKVNNNRRNGISIITARNLKLENVHITNTNGTSPQSGLDIEPNSSSDIIENIEINSLITQDNKGDGITLILSRLLESPKFSSLYNSKCVTISIVDHIDLNSKSGLRINGRSKNSNKMQIEKALDGQINIINPKWFGHTDALIFAPSKKRGESMEFDFIPQIKLINSKIYNSEGKYKEGGNSFLRKIQSNNHRILIN